MKRYVPMLDWISRYTKDDFKGDLNAGLTVGVMLIPQGMAYAVLAGLPPVYGLYASLVPLFIYAGLGTSRHLGFGPVALLSLLVLAGVSEHAEPGTDRFIQLAILTAFSVGVVQLLMGLLKGGFLVNFLSHPVLSGFVSAAAIIIGASQIGNLLGIAIPRDSTVYEIFVVLFSNFGDINIPAAVTGLGAIALMLIIKKIRPAVPAAIAVVVLGIMAAWLLNLEEKGLLIIGEIPSGLPVFETVAVSLNDIALLWPTILAISFISFMESIAVAKAIATKKGYKVDANQELIGMGAANLAGSFFQAFPTTGGFSRTAVNAQSGGRTTMSSVISALLVAATLLFLTPLFHYLPMAILAAIIILAVVSLFDYKEIGFLWRNDRKDLVLLGITFFVTLFAGIEQGIIAGVVLSVVMVTFNSARPHTAEVGRIGDSRIFRNINRYPDAVTSKDVLIYRFDAVLYFANTEHFEQTLENRIAEHGDELRLVILDASSINDIDSTGMHVLRKVIGNLKERRIHFVIAGIHWPVRDKLQKCGIPESMGDQSFFLDIEDALKYYNSDLQPVAEKSAENVTH